MRLWIVSDLHLELTRGWDLPPPALRPRFDVLIIAGDLIPRAERGVKWLRERVPDRPIVYIMGNHEFYGVDIDRTVEKAKEAAVGTNVHVLQNETVRIGNVTFAGATLWTDFALFGDQRRAMAIAAERINDFRKIRVNRYVERFRPPHALARHEESRAFLETELRKAHSGPIVVVTHHAPHAVELWISDSPTADDILTAAYRSDLTLLMSPGPDDGRGVLRPADLWIFGHTHESEDTVIGHTRVVSNPKGYGPWRPGLAWDNSRFDLYFVVEI
ncbi:putative phosphodiesterase [Bradyrhizobium sp. AZCC 1588]|uniref:metallophosphoesterase n=1 Tax=unclassified Bradyrhizobium TaxID=2631580 RepID=UPI002FEEC156